MKKLLLEFGIVIAIISVLGLYAKNYQKSKPALSKPSTLTSNSSPSPTPSNIRFLYLDNVRLQAEVADSENERVKGLSGREKLGDKEAMLFDYQLEPGIKTFWMKDMLISIDIIWVSKGKIVKIDKQVKPEPGIDEAKLTKYSSQVAIDYVIETRSGFCDKYLIKVGEEFRLEKKAD